MGYSSGTSYSGTSGGSKPTPGSSKNTSGPTYYDPNSHQNKPIRQVDPLQASDSGNDAYDRTVPVMGAGNKLHNHSIRWLVDNPTKSGYDIGSLQKQLERAGLLDPKDYAPGLYDEPTQKAFLYALELASGNQMQLGALFDQLVSSGYAANQMSTRKGPKEPISLTDPNAINDAVDKVAPNIIGRNFTDAEKQAIVAGYHSLETQYQRSQYAGGTGTNPDLGGYIEQQAKALHPEEATDYGNLLQARVFMHMIGAQ